MGECSRFVGIDVHGQELVVCRLDAGTGEVAEARYPHDARGLRRLVRWATAGAEGAPQGCYEAGQWGFQLQRKLAAMGLAVIVVAPSRIARQAGPRVKCDRLDARRMAVLLSQGALTEVTAPTVSEEAAREVVRCREDARKALHAAQQQLVKLLVRWGHQWPAGRKRWTRAYWAWVREVELPAMWAQRVLEECCLRVSQRTEELARADGQVAELAEADGWREVVGRLRCYRGIDTLTAVGLATELYQVTRLGGPREAMSFVGLVPREESSGARERRGAVTKTGNKLVRRLLVEAARHAAGRNTVSVALRRRRAGQPAAAIARADRAQGRLHRKYWRLVQRGKQPHVAVVAVARELMGFVWAELRAA